MDINTIPQIGINCHKTEIELQSTNGERVIVSIDISAPATHISKLIGHNNNVITIQTYVYDNNNNCYRKYNPQISNNRLDLAWLLQATQENLNKLIDRVKFLTHAA